MDDIESITFFGIFVSVVFSFLVSMADSFLKGLDKNQVIEVSDAGLDKYENNYALLSLSLIHISEPTTRTHISYALF